MAIDEFENALKKLLDDAVRDGISAKQLSETTLEKLWEALQKDLRLRSGL